MWIIMCCCGGVRVGEAGHPGPGFDDPELGVGGGSVSAWDEDEGSIDQLWLEDCFAGSGAEPFVKCSKFEGAKAGYVFKLDDCGLGYYLDDRHRPSSTGCCGPDRCEWPKYMGTPLEHSLSLPEGGEDGCLAPVTLCLDHLLFDAWLRWCPTFTSSSLLVPREKYGELLIHSMSFWCYSLFRRSCLS